jgi:quinoprotein dehydrogenase-associated probable ABC transporter substrate-binding protein
MAGPTLLRVCADPNNLPFSNSHQEGLENRLAELVGRELGARVVYTWWPQRRGFFRETLNGGRCDVVLGVPAGLTVLATTRPYYRSTYVFVTRRADSLQVRSFDDPLLHRLRIGVQLAGGAEGTTPPVYALAHRGLMDRVEGYSLYADYARPNPPARVLDALARGEVDVAVTWGPLAGYFARREPVRLRVVPVAPAIDPSGVPLTFAIAMGVRKGDERLRLALDRVLERRHPEIQRILDHYGVPRLAIAEARP